MGDDIVALCVGKASRGSREESVHTRSSVAWPAAIHPAQLNAWMWMVRACRCANGWGLGGVFKNHLYK